jgi:hypothetical protein
VIKAGIAQLARASAFQAEGRGFESRFPLQFDEANKIPRKACETQAVQGATEPRSEAYHVYAAVTRRGSNAGMRSVPHAGRAHVAQSAEHVLGKDEVTGSIPVVGSRNGLECMEPCCRCKEE